MTADELTIYLNTRLRHEGWDYKNLLDLCKQQEEGKVQRLTPTKLWAVRYDDWQHFAKAVDQMLGYEVHRQWLPTDDRYKRVQDASNQLATSLRNACIEWLRLIVESAIADEATTESTIPEDSQ